MISGVFIFNHKGDCIISRTFRDDINRDVVGAFRVNVVHSRHAIKAPVTNIGRTSYFHLKRGTLWLVAVSKLNANAALIFEFLNRFLDVMKDYFGEFTELNVKNNFTLIYELLDELVDYGYPQNTDSSALRAIIAQQALTELEEAETQNQITSQVTGQISWRRPDIKYRKHELFLDVLESVSVLESPSGTLHEHVSGSVRVRSYLSGMPECKFGINDKILSSNQGQQASSQPHVPAGLKKKKKKGPVRAAPIAIDDLTFHQCVKLGKFDVDRSINFVPPDGEFELMKYRTTQDIKLPFKVTPLVHERGNKIDINVIVKAQFDDKMVGTHVEVRVPVPTITSKVHVRADRGKAKYKSGDNAIVWKMKKINGGRSAQLNAQLDLLPSNKKWTRSPISINFEVPFACSGLQVKYLKLQERKLGYDDDSVVKWVRYISSSGSYEIRY